MRYLEKFKKINPKNSLRMGAITDLYFSPTSRPPRRSDNYALVATTELHNKIHDFLKPNH
jgi:hypothetical protein